MIMEELAANAKKSDALNCLDERGQTALYEAIESGDLEAVKILVRAGANVERVCSVSESALHVAARAMQHHVLKYFLDNHDIPNSDSKHNYTAMHFAAISGELESMKLLIEKFGVNQLTRRNNEGSTVWHKIAGWGAIEIARFLLKSEDLKYRFDLNLVDNDGNTPVYLSVRQGDVAMTALLLRNGATLSVKGEKETAIKLIAKEFTNPLTFLENVFNECVYENKKSVKVDFKMLTNSDSKGEGSSQIKVMEELVRCRLSKLLKHPMIESLIYLKWKCLLPVFYIIVATYAVFLGAFNIFVVITFNELDTSNVTCPEQPCAGDCAGGHWLLVAIIYISIGVLLAQECVWIHLQRLSYFKHLEPWVKLIGLALCAAVPLTLGLGCVPARAPTPGARYAACVALLLAWLQATLLLARFPGWGYYVLMFERVAITVLKVLTTSICLVIGFSVCFMILYQSKPPFDGPVAAFLKTLVMMSSEFDYEDLFNEDHNAELKDTKPFVRLIFVMFVIFIAVVMMNFMTGVAVSDISELKEIGHTRRLEKQVELLSTLEGLGDTGLGKRLKLSLIHYHSDMGRSLAAQGRRWIVYPNQYNRHTQYFQQNFELDLHNEILSLAKKKKQGVNKLDALYEAVIGTPQEPKPHTDDTENGDQGNIIDKTLKDRIKSIEDANKEIVQSIADLRKNMDSILTIMVSNMSPAARGRVVSSKALSRKRKLNQKFKETPTR